MTEKTILVVEDEKIVGRDLQACLTDLGYTVPVVVETAELAVEKAGELRPALVLMDIMLKGETSGIEAASSIKDQFDIPVIFLTAYSDDTILDQAKVAEPFGFIIKPYQERELASTIEMALYKARMERKVKHLNDVLRAIRKVGQVIVNEKDRNHMLQGICDALVDTRGYHHAWIILMDQGRQMMTTVGSGLEPQMEQVLYRKDACETMHCILKALDEPGTTHVEHADTVCGNCPLNGNFGDRLGLVTALVHCEESYGVIGVSLGKEAIKVEEERNLFFEVAGDIAFSLFNIERDEERHKAEEALQASEMRLRSLMDVSPVGIYLTDAEGSCSFVNRRWCEMAGLTPEQAMGKGWQRALHPEDRQQIFDTWTELTASGGDWGLEYRFQTPEGKVTWVFGHATHLKDDEGNITGYIGSNTDITERKLLEDSLRESENQFRRISDESLTGIFIHQNGKLAYVNLCLARMLGYDPDRPEEYIGKPFLDFVHPDEREFVAGNVMRRMKGEAAPDQYAARLINKQGRTVWVEVLVNLIDIGGQPAAMGNILNITRRRAAEQALIKERNRAQDYLDIADVMLVALDTESRVSMINRKGCQVLGYPEEEILGKVWFDHFLPEYLRDKIRIISGKILRDEIEPVRYFENPVLTRDGSERMIAWHNAEIKDDSGTIIGHLSSGEDITERKQAEAEKEKLESQLRQAMKMEAIGRLAGGIAHDFNNILTGIIGYAELIQSKISPHDPILPDLKEIQDAGERAAALTHQLLAFSRKQIITPKVIDLNKTIDRANRMIGRIIGEDIELNFTPADPIWPVRMDPAQVDQILINLATNARDAMPSGGKLTIETANASLGEDDRHHVDEELPPGDYTMITVSDNGAGMEADTRDKMFEPFFSTKEKDRGTGLGLATVYGIVKQSDGYISVYSEIDCGTTFKIYFPREKTAVEPQLEPVVSNHPRGSETVLLVEDEDMVRTLAVRILEKQGYRVLTAIDGEDAMKRCRNVQGMVDLLLTDVIMPRMNGRELFDEIKEMQPDLKVLFMSGYTDDVVARHGILEEGTNFLAKPFTIREISRAVRQALDDD